MPTRAQRAHQDLTKSKNAESSMTYVDSTNGQNVAHRLRVTYTRVMIGQIAIAVNKFY